MTWLELLKQFKHGIQLKVVADCSDYRKLAARCCRPTDQVLEVGCSTGLTSEVLANHAQQVLAIDHSPSVLEQTAQDHPQLTNVNWQCIDARDFEAIKTLLPEPDVIFLDMGGDIQLGNIATTLREYLLTFKPRVFIIRSIELAILVSCVDEVILPPEDHQTPSLLNPERKKPLESLLNLSRSPIANDRLFAIRKLIHIDDPAAKARVKEMMKDGNSKIKRIAIGNEKE